MAGYTLMNNQIGAVVAQVLAKKPNVKVMYLPSMIRIDGVGRFDLD
jgi:propane monooxygenase coupling protein